jgi:rfaE bifunctional protein kinase chain/domain
MTPDRFQTITERYAKLRIALIGDFCLDRYLEIDPAREEISIETGLPVHNVVNLRTQPGGAGTILSNLIALGAGEVHPVGFCGEDGEGFELSRALEAQARVTTAHLLRTKLRRTFTYCKPLITERGKPPRELNRLDSKNWTPTPAPVEDKLIEAVHTLASKVDAMILLDQVDVLNTGVVTTRVLDTVREVAKQFPKLPIFADSRRGLRDFPPLIFKMNASELATLTSNAPTTDIATVKKTALRFAQQNGQPVFVTLSEHGIVGALPEGVAEHAPSLPVHEPIDIVGAGDSVMANLAMALAAGATLPEALELANAAASIVIHQLGTTGTASLAQLQEVLIQPA